MRSVYRSRECLWSGSSSLKLDYLSGTLLFHLVQVDEITIDTPEKRVLLIQGCRYQPSQPSNPTGNKDATEVAMNRFLDRPLANLLREHSSQESKRGVMRELRRSQRVYSGVGVIGALKRSVGANYCPTHRSFRSTTSRNDP